MNPLQVGQMLFISDLHLSPARPQVTSMFLGFLQQRARCAQALYILGDLFDCWVGDDDPTPPRDAVLQGLSQLTEAGTDVYIVQGNRDFLLAEGFAVECGAHILDDCAVIDCHGVPTLLMHGDLLCSDDAVYQAFRVMSRTDQWKRNVLARPLWLRLGLARWYRLKSYFHKRAQVDDIMDVNPDTVRQYAQCYNVLQIIHGHTHRPGSHTITDGCQSIRRYVLGEWKRSAKIVSFDADGLKFERISMRSSGELSCQKIAM